MTAQKKLGLRGCLCEVRQGSKWDAIAFAAQSDLNSAVPRTQEDRGRAVDLMLQDPTRMKWSNEMIALHCGVSEGTVRNHRTKLEQQRKIEPSPLRTGKDGRNTKIGARKRRLTQKSSRSSDSHRLRESSGASDGERSQSAGYESVVSEASPSAIVSATSPTAGHPVARRSEVPPRLRVTRLDARCSPGSPRMFSPASPG